MHLPYLWTVPLEILHPDGRVEKRFQEGSKVVRQSDA